MSVGGNYGDRMTYLHLGVSLVLLVVVVVLIARARRLATGVSIDELMYKAAPHNLCEGAIPPLPV
jgi:hypothetical protein